ncbi:hypothetical protein [Bacillus salipaludis]|uniref:Uncharacterized protein n=1 Tax=Bacillus salipaludis TaxID=2547811 RepID=A0AA90TD81_9BACI|nr:hypothetical protein [Bacillus salipaludis]MDQ6598122.1 hypothetical protein [Bacillus salipaludis]
MSLQTKPPLTKEDYSLTPKQIEFALSLIEKTREYELAMYPANLTVKDLNKLIAFNRYKNKGIIVNLVKKGVLRKKALGDYDGANKVKITKQNRNSCQHL